MMNGAISNLISPIEDANLINYNDVEGVNEFIILHFETLKEYHIQLLGEMVYWLAKVDVERFQKHVTVAMTDKDNVQDVLLRLGKLHAIVAKY